jgi:hypothetical protein
MARCSNNECNLDTYAEFDECILHCPKDDLDFFTIRSDFYNSLEEYAARNKHNEFCHFNGIHFPKADVQSTINYTKILATLKQIHFDNCHFYTSYLDMGKPEFFFQDCCFHEDWTIRNYKLLKNEDDVIYQNCTFLKKVHTYLPEHTGQYTYDYSQFDYTCTFKNDITLYRSLFKLSPFNGNQNNYKSNTFFKLLIDKCEFNVFEIYLQNQKNGEIEITSSNINTKLKIRSEETGDYEEQRSHKSKLKKLKIVDCIVSDNAYIRIGYLDADEFILSNLRNPQSSELNIGDCHFNSFTLSNFRNIGRFKLYKINVFRNESGRLFQIDNTSIGDTDFQSIRLTSFSTVRLFDNIFSNIRYTNMQWKEAIEVGEFHNDKIVEIAKKRDTYRVLKNVAHSNNDQPQSLLFYSKEMQHHKDLTIKDKCKSTSFDRYYLKDIFCINNGGWIKEGRLSDIITLIFNEKTNSFGLDWWQPIKLILLFSLLFYFLLLLSLNTDNATLYWKNYFVFLNPAHAVEFIAENKWTGYSYFIDFSFRIIEGLLLYQTIVAFRKFTKKS